MRQGRAALQAAGAGHSRGSMDAPPPRRQTGAHGGGPREQVSNSRRARRAAKKLNYTAPAQPAITNIAHHQFHVCNNDVTTRPLDAVAARSAERERGKGDRGSAAAACCSPIFRGVVSARGSSGTMQRRSWCIVIALVSCLVVAARAAEPPAAYKDCLASGLSDAQTTYQDFVAGKPAR